MSDEITLKPIAHIRSDFQEKFGIPKQSGIVGDLRAEIIFEPDFRDPSCLSGLSGFSYIWLIWGFSENFGVPWTPTVRPPHLGGNKRVGVFASRSPFRPNPLALSSVKIISIDTDAKFGNIITVSGADLLDGTPIYDIKPYIPQNDIHADADRGYSSPGHRLEVSVDDTMLADVPEEKRKALIGILSCDPRPAYQNDPERIYNLAFADFDIRFRVGENVLTVLEIKKNAK
ncbi:MAG: tRNA (N6-threonylcarbamoyladenosine(37)-N6)-methyltransferase TrmO [Eubacteriaceae bacterium]|jgi:tRNA-Thr(GGU) m(6)t(6)A37 methyltransferase TsaA|nr:tRNA (N6-threonylcarbamoyladenosine(37)-N6)-methyltransferase TrmO [Eubacteriaceae bacterium]